MFETFSSTTEEVATKQEKKQLMSRLGEKLSSSKKMLALAAFVTLLSSPHLKEVPSNELEEKADTIEDILVAVQSPELTEKIRFIDGKYQDFKTPLPEHAGLVSFDYQSMYEASGDKYVINDKETGFLSESDEDIIFSHGGYMAILQDTNENDTDFFDSRTDNYRLAKPMGGTIEASGKAFTIEDSSTLSKKDALIRALTEASNQISGLHIEAKTEVKTETDQGRSNIEQELTEFVSTNSVANIDSYKITEYREETEKIKDSNGTETELTNHFITLEIIPGKFVPATEGSLSNTGNTDQPELKIIQ